MKIDIVPRNYKPDTGKKRSSQFPITLQLAGDADTLTVDDVQKAIHERFSKYYPDRQRLTVEKQVLKSGHPLIEYQINDGDSITFKDLGPQVPWRKVFLLEYLGPLIFHPLLYHFPELFYNERFEHSALQTAAYYMVLAHYIKRELESIFVHRFSHNAMPVRSFIKNSFHYYILCGANVGYWVYGPWMAAGTKHSAVSTNWFWTAIVVFTLCELGNLWVHVSLRNLRPPGTRQRRIPYGLAFSLVSCPNYTFELLAWLTFSLFVRSLSAWIFFGASLVQIYIWALKKHIAYRREFPDYPHNRKALIPFVA